MPKKAHLGDPQILMFLCLFSSTQSEMVHFTILALVLRTRTWDVGLWAHPRSCQDRPYPANWTVSSLLPILFLTGNSWVRYFIQYAYKWIALLQHISNVLHEKSNLTEWLIVICNKTNCREFEIHGQKTQDYQRSHWNRRECDSRSIWKIIEVVFLWNWSKNFNLINLFVFQPQYVSSTLQLASWLISKNVLN